jgi:hypothetical protein
MLVVAKVLCLYRQHRTEICSTWNTRLNMFKDLDTLSNLTTFALIKGWTSSSWPSIIPTKYGPCPTCYNLGSSRLET